MVRIVLDFNGVVAQLRREAVTHRGHIGVQRTLLTVRLHRSREVGVVDVHLFGILAQDEEREGCRLGVHPAVAAQHAAHLVDVVLHRRLIHIAEHLDIGKEGEVAGTRTEGIVVI